MKIELQIPKLKHAISLTERISGKHATLPVLSCILIEVGKNTAIFKSTNLDVGIEISVSVKSEGSGVVAIPANIISAFVSQLPDQGSAILELDSGNLMISSASTKVVIKAVPSDDFPIIPKIPESKEMPLPPELFVKGLKAVWYSASVSSVKPELSSVYMYRKDDSVVFVATDSFRLAEKKVKFPLVADMPDVLIPFKNVPDLIRVLEQAGDLVRTRISKNLISFETDTMYLASRVIDGVFPDYQQIIPKGYVTEAVVLKQDILNGLKISNVFSDKFNQIKISIDPAKKSFDVQTKNSDVGENKTSISAAISGEGLDINFNYKYIVDCFQSIDADSVSFQLSGLNRPMVIRPVSGDQTFMYLAMPMNR